MTSIFASFSLSLCVMLYLTGLPSTESIIFNVTVAQDGSGDYTKISDAIAVAPVFSQTRYYIRIKPGIYNEHIEVWNNKTYLALIGDNAATTKITDGRSNGTGYRTSESATLSVNGEGFMAQFLTVENSAGPLKGQAVALYSESNHSAFYKCVFLGYQDTLYAHGNFQFYKDCDIYGSVDFIFGRAVAVFQDCRLYARLPNGEITFTAQGKDNSTINSGFSFHNCTVTIAPELRGEKLTIKAFLGRPWRIFSTVVFIQSFLDDIVDPSGWLKFNDTSPLDLLFYGEYNNWGPGANTSRRVKWPGYKVIKHAKEAQRFTVNNFIGGNHWIPETGIPYTGGLIV